MATKTNRWLKTAGKKTVSTRKKADKSKIFDKLPSLNKVIYAYKIYNNANNPTIRSNGHSFVKLVEGTIFEKVDFTMSGVKSQISDVDDGAKSSGKNIVKYKTLSILNFEAETMGEFDIFSPTPITTGTIIDNNTPNIFTYEEGDSINEIDPITNARTDSSDESVSFISFNSQAKLSTEKIELEVYNLPSDIPEYDSTYKLKNLLIESDVNFGLNRLFARGRVGEINKFFNLKLDDSDDNKFVIVKSFTIDEDMFDSYEPFFDPSRTLFWEEQKEFFKTDVISKIFNTNTAIGKAQYNLVMGAKALSWLLKNNFEGIARDAQGILSGSCRGVNLANLDRASDKSLVMEDAIDHWLQFLPITGDKNKALRILAALSDGILNNKYVFPGDTAAIGLPWHFKSTNLFNVDWLDIAKYPEINIITVHNIYTLDADGNINGIQQKWKELSRVKFINTGVNEVSIDFITDKASKVDYSPYPGENDTKDISKDYIMYPVKKWEDVENLFKESKTVLYHTGDEQNFIQQSTISSIVDLPGNKYSNGFSIDVIRAMEGWWQNAGIGSGTGIKRTPQEVMDRIFEFYSKELRTSIKAPVGWTFLKINSELLEIDGITKGAAFYDKYKEMINGLASNYGSNFIYDYYKKSNPIVSIKYTADETYKADKDIIINNSKNTYITDEEIITDRQLSIFGVNKHSFEVILDESVWKAGTILSSMYIKNKYGTQLKITKIYETILDDGTVVPGSKEYIVKLGSGQSPENQLTEIGFGI